MTLPDVLVEQAHSVFRDEYHRIFPSGGDEGDHEEAVRSAVAAVLEFQTQRIVEWLRSYRARSVGDQIIGPNTAAKAIQREFGVAHPEERAA